MLSTLIILNAIMRLSLSPSLLLARYYWYVGTLSLVDHNQNVVTWLIGSRKINIVLVYPSDAPC